MRTGRRRARAAIALMALAGRIVTQGVGGPAQPIALMTLAGRIAIRPARVTRNINLL
jgi:hypothetical protein